MEAFVSIGLYLSYVLLAVCLLAAVIMPLVKAFGDPQSLKKIGLGIGSLALVFIVSYVISGGEARGEASENTVKLVGASLTTFYILGALAIVGIVVTEVKKVFE